MYLDTLFIGSNHFQTNEVKLDHLGTVGNQETVRDDATHHCLLCICIYCLLFYVKKIPQKNTKWETRAAHEHICQFKINGNKEGGKRFFVFSLWPSSSKRRLRAAGKKRGTAAKWRLWNIMLDIQYFILKRLQLLCKRWRQAARFGDWTLSWVPPELNIIWKGTVGTEMTGLQNNTGSQHLWIFANELNCSIIHHSFCFFKSQMRLRTLRKNWDLATAKLRMWNGILQHPELRHLTFWAVNLRMPRRKKRLFEETLRAVKKLKRCSKM